jgi:hypothetical protein
LIKSFITADPSTRGASSEGNVGPGATNSKRKTDATQDRD